MASAAFCWRYVSVALARAALVAVIMAVTSSLAFAATRTWTGANSGLWSDPANWGGVAPVPGDDLVFPQVARKNNTNDFAAGTEFNSITFTGSNYIIGGNHITLGAGGITQNVPFVSINVVVVDLFFAATRTISLTGAGAGVLSLGGVISGAGGLTVYGNTAVQTELDLLGANTFAGGTILNDVFAVVGNDHAFGTGSVTTNPDVTINMVGHTVGNTLSTQGFGIGNNAAVSYSGTWTGPVTLTGNTAFGSNSTSGLSFSGTISGTFSLTAPLNNSASFVVLNGISPGFTGTLSPYDGTLFVNAAFANAAANLAGAAPFATLGGTGSIGGSVTIPANRHLAPGFNGPGILGTGNLSLGSGSPSGSQFDVQLNGMNPGSGYDQVNVTGTVTLGGSLNVSLGFVPAVGAQFTIINNDGTDSVSGTFAGLPEGAQFVVAGTRLHITYAGGSGNDVVLTVGSSQGRYDFDGDFKTDRTVFRPSTGFWYSALSGGGATATGWGVSTDVDVPGDYDGDGKTDIAVWRPSTGTWYIVYSSNGSVHTVVWGTNDDIPLAGDVDGDGKADEVIFRPSTGTWFFKKSGGGTSSLGWGTNGDQPLLGDFDRDGKMDATIYRPNTGVWYVALSGGESFVVAWGVPGDIPTSGDWDGDGKSDPAVFRPSTGEWFINKSSGGTIVVGWGVSGDIPVSGDWDNDGKSDFTIWRTTSGAWFTQLSGGGSAVVGWGVTGDKPAGRVPGS